MLQHYAWRWQQELKENFPRRRFVPLVIDMNGRTAFVCRYLRPIKAPPEIEAAFQIEQKSGADLACRIVSLVPFVADSVLFPGNCDIWSTCDVNSVSSLCRISANFFFQSYSIAIFLTLLRPSCILTHVGYTWAPRVSRAPTLVGSAWIPCSHIRGLCLDPTCLL